MRTKIPPEIFRIKETIKQRSENKSSKQNATFFFRVLIVHIINITVVGAVAIINIKGIYSYWLEKFTEQRKK